jgi:hypothetical protein
MIDGAHLLRVVYQAAAYFTAEISAMLLPLT